MSLNTMRKATAICLVAVSSLGVAIAGGAEKRVSHSRAHYPVELSNYSDNTGVYLEGHGGYAYRPWVDSNTYFGGLDVANNLSNSSNANAGFIGGADLGYQVSQNFSAEAGWFYLPTQTLTDTSGTTPVRVRMTSGLAYAALKGSIPVFSNASVFGKLGAAYTYDDSTPSIPSSDGTHRIASSYHWSPAFAAGAQYYMTPNFSMSAQYMYVPGDNAVLSDRFTTPAAQLFTLSAGYKFLV